MGDGTQSAKAAPREVERESVDNRLDVLLEKQRAFFKSGATLPRAFREDRLRSLRDVMVRRQSAIIEAVAEDLGRAALEAYAVEVGQITSEIRHVLKKLGGWMRPRKSFAPLTTVPSRSAIHMQPLGLNLIISPWNYPIQLALSPLVPCIAAGNVAVIKPSELAPACSALTAEIIREAFSEEHVACVEGGIEVSKALLDRKWAHIFFTGGTEVGRIVAKAGAENLSRVTLELGGKSPVIVTDSANIAIAAKRIAWGKWFNAGQTCIAPDYLLAHASIQEELVDAIRQAAKASYGEDPKQSPDLARIINGRHFERLTGLIDPDKVVLGGESDAKTRYVAPTVMTNVTLDDKVMGEEIFGPILPVLTIESLDDAIEIIDQRAEPLALYLFTSNPEDEKKIIDRVSFGGGCINNTLLHFADPKLPFGGIGTSGQGAYHGHYGFETFSHRKGVLKTGNFLDPSIKYPPYDESKLGIWKKLLR